MRYSLSLGRPFGIKIAVHWTFLLLIIWIVAINIRHGASTSQVILSVLFILALFVCVTLHELGHSLAARRFGTETKSITLLPIGGMANIEDIPEKPREEIIMTVSGLIVNVIIALVLWVIVTILPGENFDRNMEHITGQNFLSLLMYVNLFIVAFNLIPAFPMDGGRILRAVLSIRFDRVSATRYSMMVGQVFGVIFALVGLFINPFLFVIGIFVVMGARLEYTQVRFTSFLVDHTAGDILMEDYASLQQEEPLKHAVDLLLRSSQKGFPVKEGDEVVGILTKNDIIGGLSRYGEDAPVREVMTTGFKHVDAATPLRDIFMTMQRERTDILPVFDGRKLIGVIDQDNIQEFIMVQSALRES
jgi:Zn-dependent protease/predicted transcriptional regulator